MLVNGRAFDGLTRMLDTYHHLLINAGIDRWFSELNPVHTYHIDVMYELLLDLDKKGVCCFLTGTYVLHLAGLVHQHASAAMFVVMTECHAVRLIFQRDLPAPLSFYLGNFLFTAVDDVDLDSLAYVVSNESRDFSLYIVFHGVDTTANTGSSCNLDFVYFIWQYLERLSFKKHALVLHPSDDLFHTRPRLLSLRHYRAASDGWNDSDDRPLRPALPGRSTTFLLMSKACYCRLCLPNLPVPTSILARYLSKCYQQQ
jgi:hypothetical protein